MPPRWQNSNKLRYFSNNWTSGGSVAVMYEGGGCRGATPVPIITSEKKYGISHEQKKEKVWTEEKSSVRKRVRVVVALVQQFVLLGCGPLNLPQHYMTCVNVCVCMKCMRFPPIYFFHDSPPNGSITDDLLFLRALWPSFATKPL